MGKQSAGILLYKKDNEILKFFIVHPGGSYWENDNEYCWSIPKGEFIDEEPFEAAKREFIEETSIKFDFNKKHIELSPVKQKSGKTVYAYAFEGDVDADSLVSNTFKMIYKGFEQEFPEVDKATWATKEEAQKLLNKAQYNFIIELENKIC